MDDKAKIAIGELRTPEAATSHNRRALTKSDIILEASDHNYHSVNITPSVILSYEIPNSPQESFYSGQIYVSLKDSVYHGSDPLRHIVELCAVLESNTSEKPFLTLFRDGGSDHNITFLFVRCCLLALFLIKDYVILNVGRCAPYQRNINPAESCMSLLNIGLQGLALEREDAGVFEAAIKSSKSMKTLRQSAQKSTGLKKAYHTSTESARKKVEDVFSSLKLKGKPVGIYRYVTCSIHFTGSIT